MGDTEVRRVMRVLFHAVELTRELYGRGGHTPRTARLLESAGHALWQVQEVLVSEEVERHAPRLETLATQLRTYARGLKPVDRNVSEAVSDASDTIAALAAIARIGIEAGLVG